MLANAAYPLAPCNVRSVTSNSVFGLPERIGRMATSWRLDFAPLKK